MKRIIVLLASICLVSALCFTSFAVSFADEEEPLPRGLTVSKDGVISWEPVEGNADYWISVNGTGSGGESGENITERLPGPGQYEICVTVYDHVSGRSVGSAVLYIEYDGSSYKTIESDAKDFEGLEEGTLAGVKLTEDGVLSWDEYDRANQYWCGIDGDFLPAENPLDLKEKVGIPGTYVIELNAYGGIGSNYRLASYTAKFVFDGTGFELLPIETTDGGDSGEPDETPEGSTVPQNVNTDGKKGDALKKALLIILPVAAAAAAAAIVILLIKNGRKK